MKSNKPNIVQAGVTLFKKDNLKAESVDLSSLRNLRLPSFCGIIDAESDQKFIQSKRQKVRFGDIMVAGPRNGIYKSKEYHGRGSKIVNMGELFANPRLWSIPMKRVVLSDKELQSTILKPGDLLFARRSLVAAGAGRCSIVMAVDDDTTFESSIIRVRPNAEHADSNFLALPR